MYDVIISGAGLAGSTAGEILSKVGYKVIIFDKNKFPWRKPCGGGIPYKCVSEFKISRDFAESFIYGVKIVSSSGKELKIRYGDYTNNSNHFDYVVDRKVFDQYYRDRAVDSGVELHQKTAVLGVIRKDDMICGVKIRNENGELEEVKSRAVISADGVGSRTVVDAGLRKKWKKNEYVILATAIISGYTGDSDFNYLIFSNEIAPNCYAWIFPMGDRRANIGVGIDMSIKGNPMDYLKKFLKHRIVKENFDEPKIYWKANYPIPIDGIKGKTYGNGILAVGDAAGFVSPLIGEGIHYAFITGKLAAETLVKALENENLTGEFLKRYREAWINRGIKKNFRNQAMIRDIFLADLENFTELLINWAFEDPENKNLFSEMFINGLEISDELIKKVSTNIMDFIKVRKK